MNRIKAESGFSMIEMMISLLILAIGLLGQMALQMTSVSSNQSSYYRSQASIIANDFTDRMRLNADAIKAGLANYDSLSIDATSTNTSPGCAAAGCTAADLALLDIFELQETLSASIPSGAVTVEKDATITSQAAYKITITWQLEDRAGLTNGANVNKFEMDFGI
ncbi:MAG: type IV pilus modification protein PilV [Cellvibrionaceae bacterium]